MCITYSGPNRTEELSLMDGYHFIDESKKLDLLISIAGGEPFLCFEKLKSLITYAHERDLANCVVTNAYWATSERKSHRILKELKDCGLTMMKVSLDDFHQKFIPLESVVNAIRGGKKAGIQIQLQNTKTSIHHDMKYYAFQLAAFHNIDFSQLNANEDTRLPVGRRKEMYPQPDFLPFDSLSTDVNRCFKELLVDVSGDLYPCCNPLMAPIGNLKYNSMQEILQTMKTNRYYNIIKTHGFLSFAHILEKEKKINLSQMKFVNECHLCTYLFSIPKIRALLGHDSEFTSSKTMDTPSHTCY
jgi:organic radical activating enzyme